MARFILSLEAAEDFREIARVLHGARDVTAVLGVE